MSLKDIAPAILEHNRKIVRHQTWGHLFPDSEAVFEGTLVVAQSAYGDLAVLQDKSNVPQSPWWYASMTDFVYDFLRRHDSPGTVYLLEIASAVVDADEGAKQIKIELTGEKIVLEA